MRNYSPKNFGKGIMTKPPDYRTRGLKVLMGCVRPWIDPEWKYLREGGQWLIGYYGSNWLSEVKYKINRIGLTIKEHCPEHLYFVCEVTEKTKVFEIKKLKNSSGIKNVGPNWAIHTYHLGAKNKNGNPVLLEHCF